MSKPDHSYHLVDPSPWPFVSSLVVCLLALSAAAGMHPSSIPVISFLSERWGFYLLIPSLLILFAVVYLWWRDIVNEARTGHHSPVVQLGLRYGMVLFIISEVLFFAAFFWSFFDSSLGAIRAGITFPPESITLIPAWDLPFFNTVILLLSSCTLTWAHHALLENNRRDLIRGLSLTLILGVLFTTIQIFEYAHASFPFSGSNFAGIFYMATGFHGAHVLIGSTFLLVCLIRSIKGHFTPTHHFGLEAAAWYWHFVDVVWLFLFVCVYVWGGR